VSGAVRQVRHRIAAATAAVALAVVGCDGRSSSTATPQPTRSPSPSAASPSAAAPTPSTPGTKAPGGFRVVVAADIACDPSDEAYAGGAGSDHACQQRATAELAARLRPDAVLLPGDLQYARGELANFRRVFAKTWGRFRSITYPAPGNHEYGRGVASGYYDYFGPRAGPRGKGYYSADVGSWHLVSLNSNCELIGGCGTDSPQARWLRADLARNHSRCTVALWHHPRWSSGLHGSTTKMDPLWRVLVAGDVDVLLTGHDHHYERFAPLAASGAPDRARGVREFVVGTGGNSLYPVLFRRRGSEVRIADTFGVLELTLTEGSYSWRFVPAAGGDSTDAGSSSCH
jgi:hypothetical protein